MPQHYYGITYLGRGFLGYTVGLSAICSALFVLIAVRDGWRLKTYGMPPLAIVSFLSAWLIALIGPFTNQSHLFPGSRAEFVQFGVPFVLGTIILLQYLRYGPTDHPLLPHLTDRFRLLLWAQFVVVFAGLWSFVVYYQDYYVNEMEPIQNLVASGSLLAAAVLRQDLRGLSVPGAWFFLLGNLLLHVAMVAGDLSDPYPDAANGYYFIYWPMSTIFVVNLGYAILLRRRKRDGPAQALPIS